MTLISIAEQLRDEASLLSFERPVAYVYNPLVYAWQTHEAYLRRFGQGHPDAVLLGMNPGPFGMAQTGVPFGDVAMVTGWMGLKGAVGRPPREHPKRPIAGFDCPRREVSGQRLWGWARDRFVTPEHFFAHFFVLNYCPLTFLEETGRNRTPNALPRREREPLFACCDRALQAVIDVLMPRFVVGVGQFAAERAAAALAGRHGVKIGRILHPSPASPAANRGWAEQAEKGLFELGLGLATQRL